MKQTKLQSGELANLVTSAILVIVGSICLLGMWFAPQLVWLLAPGFASVPGKFELAVRLTRIMFPFLLLIALAAQATGMLNSHGSFGIPAIASIFFNIGSVGFGLLIGYFVGPYLGIEPIEGMAYGVVIGGALQFGWQRFKLHSLGYRFRFVWNWSHPGLRRISGIDAAGNYRQSGGSNQPDYQYELCLALLDPVRGHDGPVSWLGYAMRFVQVPLSLFGVAFASAMLPSVARSAALNNFNEFRKTLARSLAMVFLLTIPASLVLITLGRAADRRGLSERALRRVRHVAKRAGSGLLFAGAGGLYFGARNESRVLCASRCSHSNGGQCLLDRAERCAASAFLRVWHMGFEALALTTACAVALECVALAECLRRKLGGLEGRYLGACFLRVAVASLVMAAPLFMIDRQVFRGVFDTRIAYCGELALLLPLAAIVFFGVARFLGVQEIGFAFHSFIVPTWRRLRFRVLKSSIDGSRLGSRASSSSAGPQDRRS